jgi:hypothetical protein
VFDNLRAGEQEIRKIYFKRRASNQAGEGKHKRAAAIYGTDETKRKM